MALSRADWTEAALQALAVGGVGAVAVEPLAKTLGATKGSFYWHFADRAELVTATLELWEQRETHELIAALQQLPDPAERLLTLGRAAYTDAARGNTHAMVAAAAADPRVAAVLHRVTQTRLAFLTQLFAELGVGDQEAASRARVAYALYLGISELRRAQSPDERAQAMDADIELALQALVPPGGTRARSAADQATTGEPPTRRPPG